MTDIFPPPFSVVVHKIDALENTETQHGHLMALMRHRAMLAAAPQPPAVEQPQGEQEPLFWYRPRSNGMYEGPLHKSQIERVRKESGGWVPLYTHPQPKRQPLDTDMWPEYPAPSVRPVYATSANTKSVRDGFEVGGYEKTPPLFTKSQLYDYALNVLRAHGIWGEA